MLATICLLICLLVLTTVVMAVFNKHMVFLATLCGARLIKKAVWEAILKAVSSAVVDGGAVSVGV